MNKGFKIVAAVLAAFMGLTFLHVWLNIGFDKFMPKAAGESEGSFRVGFLPVT